jgi:hypothetical protein
MRLEEFEPTTPVLERMSRLKIQFPSTFIISLYLQELVTAVYQQTKL